MNEEQLYLTTEQCLRLKKILERLEDFCVLGAQRTSFPFSARRGLQELGLSLSEVSKTRKMIAELIEQLGQNRPERSLELVDELRSFYKLGELRFHIRPAKKVLV